MTFSTCRNINVPKLCYFKGSWFCFGGLLQ